MLIAVVALFFGCSSRCPRSSFATPIPAGISGMVSRYWPKCASAYRSLLLHHGRKTMVSWEWGADVVDGSGASWERLPGRSSLYGFLEDSRLVWFQVALGLRGNFFLACAMASPMLTTLSLHWLARPHVFGWVFALASLYALELHRPPDDASESFGIGSGSGLGPIRTASFFLLRRWRCSTPAGICSAGCYGMTVPGATSCLPRPCRNLAGSHLSTPSDINSTSMSGAIW